MLAIVLSPLFIFGSISSKIFNWISYSELRYVDSFFDWFTQTDIGEFTCRPQQRNYNTGGISYGVFMGFLCILGIVGLAVIGFLLFSGAVHINEIGSLAWSALLGIGWVGFQLCAYMISGLVLAWEFISWCSGGIWVAMQWAGSCFSDLYYWVGSWIGSSEFWLGVLGILKILGIGFGGLVAIGGAATAAGFTAMAVSKSAPAKFLFGLGAAIARRLGVWDDARRARFHERKKRKLEERARLAALNIDHRKDMLLRRRAEHKRKKEWDCEYCNFHNTEMYEVCENCLKVKLGPVWLRIIEAPFSWAIPKIVKIGHSHVYFMGFWSIVWETIKAFKTRSCTIFEVVTEAEVQNQAIQHGIALKARNERIAEERRLRREANLANLKEIRLNKPVKYVKFVKPERTWYGAKINFSKKGKCK